MNILTINDSNAELKAKLDAAIKHEHVATATILAYLGEYEVRGLHLRDGFASLYKFLTEGHGYSEGAAARRCTAARFVRKFPEMLKMISAGDLSLSVVGVLAQAQLPSDEVYKVATEMRKVSRAKAEEILAVRGIRGSQAQREVVRPILMAPAVPLMVEKTGCMSNQTQVVGASDLWPKTTEASTDEKNIEVPGPKSSGGFRVSLSLPDEVFKKLKHAQDLMGAADLAATIEKLAEFYAAKKDPLQKPAQKVTPLAVQNAEDVSTTREEPKVAAKPSRYIPVKTKREVYRLAGGRCSYVDRVTGKRCSETKHLQFDHVKPFAMGGTHDASNLRVLCAAHNRMWAVDIFGREFMAERLSLRR